MDPASQALAQYLPPNVRRTYAALAEHSNGRAFAKRHPELARRRTRALDWSRHDKNIYNKLSRPDAGYLLENVSGCLQNVYNMDETGVMLSMLGLVTVLIGKDDLRDYRGAGVKRTMVTAIKCILASGYNDSYLSLEWIKQPCNVLVFSPLKTAYRDKEHFTTLYCPAREWAMTKKNILAAWAKTGLFPFNPDRVLREITKPAAELPTALPIPTTETASYL
ncbi:hypothetical protein BCR34DRAFT_677966 [Clohesyomyces aquaticus]|uniref:Uncharacterized protein n=1 Tax=Clohesyomyces aquaticus TaxID=1231657 RepID=A0A1Y1Y190_9PLEO|nr:hypothetical protein BCR34DRAFT_677966 [Clohesyomyces aquaticus]